MPGKRGPGAGDRDWLESCWEWAGEAAGATGCSVQISISPTARRGVWRVTTRLLEVVDGRPVAIRVQHSHDWPNAERTEFLAFVHGMLMRLDYLAQQEVLAQTPKA